MTTVVLDPPRKGCDPAVLAAIRSVRVPYVIYISCNPATLARDVGILCGTCREDGAPKPTEELPEHPEYEVTYLQPFDMFPQSRHVETLVCLERKSEMRNEA